MIIKSPEFEANSLMPPKFTCDRENISPPLIFEEIPNNASSLCLTLEDLDQSAPNFFAHWLVINIDPSIRAVEEGTVPLGATQLTNDSDEIDYFGPCPKAGKKGKYAFNLYALDKRLELSNEHTKIDIEREIDGHIIDNVSLSFFYER